MTDRGSRTCIGLAVALTSAVVAVAPASATYGGNNGRFAWNEHGNIWVSNAAETDAIHIKDSDYDSEGPALSKGGRWLAFSAEKYNRRSSIFVYHLPKTALPGSGVKNTEPTYQAVIKQKKYAAFSPTWSPDARKIAFVCLDNHDHYEICVVARKGGSVKKITHCNCAHPSRDQRPEWSPKGDRIAWTQTDSVYTVKPDGSGRKKILYAPKLGWYTFSYVDWSPDGKRLLFFGYGPVDQSDLLTSKADGSNFHVALREYQRSDGNTVYVSYGLWSPNGKGYLTMIDGFHTHKSLWEGKIAGGVFQRPSTKEIVLPSDESNPQPAWANKP